MLRAIHIAACGLLGLAGACSESPAQPLLDGFRTTPPDLSLAPDHPPRICTPGETFCKTADVHRCSADGTRFLLDATCGPEGLTGVKCQVCGPGKAACLARNTPARVRMTGLADFDMTFVEGCQTRASLGYHRLRHPKGTTYVDTYSFLRDGQKGLTFEYKYIQAWEARSLTFKDPARSLSCTVGLPGNAPIPPPKPKWASFKVYRLKDNPYHQYIKSDGHMTCDGAMTWRAFTFQAMMPD